MLRFEETLPSVSPDLPPRFSSLPDPVFFDLETTGLSWRSSHLYLFGCIAARDGQWVLRQWFLDRPSQEKEMLQEVYAFLEQKSEGTLVHFNGDTFDLPYLYHKSRHYALAVPSLCTAGHSLDLLRQIRPLKKMLSLSSLRQRRLEQFLGISREDPYDGGSLIPVYQRYLETGSAGDLSSLLLHNKEDLLGMFRILPLFSYLALQDGRFCLAAVQEKPGSLQIDLQLNEPVPIPVTQKEPLYSVSLSGQSATLTIPCHPGTKKFFYSNYKDYYYFPAEGRAIHRSVAQYADRTHREPASAATCFQPVEGRFIPAPSGIKTDLFYDAYRASPAWIRIDEEWLQNRSGILSYIKALLTS